MPKIIIDLGKCIACRACEIACEKEHNGRALITVLEFEDEEVALPLSCRHCNKAPCVEVCPTNALSFDKDGAVVLDESKCNGCAMCAIVCPFSIPLISKATKVMVKCDLCSNRRLRGEIPACVEVCPTNALIYGELEEVIKKLRESKAKKVVSAWRKAIEVVAAEASYMIPPRRS